VHFSQGVLNFFCGISSDYVCWNAYRVLGGSRIASKKRESNLVLATGNSARNETFFGTGTMAIQARKRIRTCGGGKAL